MSNTNRSVVILRLLLWLFLVPVAPAMAQLVGVPVYYHTDLQGSPIAATGRHGDLLWSTDYQPYGERYATDTNGLSNKVWYTGHVQDEQTGLVYMQARYYDPVVGRFMGVDPVGFSEGNPQSFNRYAYANNNPYAFTDPDGRDAVEIVFKGYPIETGFGFKLPLGHAGVLLINNDSGSTRYYEYGRYDPDGRGIIGEKLPKELGNIRKVNVPDVVIGRDGLPTEESLSKVYRSLSSTAGKGNEVRATYHKGADFDRMEGYIRSVANDKNRQEYSVPFCNCYDFKSRVVEVGNKSSKVQ